MAHLEEQRLQTKLTEWLARVREGMRGRYVRLLEAEIERERAEIERLRAENRALLNSLLGTAGVPPIEAPPAHPAQIAPIRRRSWPQIAAAREVEAARRALPHERGTQAQAGK
jgi:hypothetical protein